MKILAWALVHVLLSAGFALAKVSPSDVKRVTNLPIVPNKFIVEVDNLSDIPTKRLAFPHEEVYASLRKRRVKFVVNKEYNTHGLFVGASLTLANAQDVVALLNTPGVKAVHPVQKFQRPVPVEKKSPRDDGILPDSQSTHILTGVDRLHAEGIFGAGIRIGIIDSGIDYTHPDLGGGFGPGYKVVGGYDFVGDAYDGSNTPVPDPDPLDQCDGHGTHVAGIIGANPGNPYNISGVAYEASLSAYRIFGCEGSTEDDVIIDALLRGFVEGQHVLTLSLGYADGWTESPTAVVASRIASTGTIVTIAAGNDGASGSWYTATPANGIDVISVASLDNTIVPSQNFILSGVDHAPIKYFKAFPLPLNDTYPIYATSNDTTIPDDACNPLPDSTPDLSPYVVIVRRGTCTFGAKLANIVAKGAKAALIYDNGWGLMTIDTGSFPTALIQAADGAFLVEQFVAGVPVTINFHQTGGSTNFPDPNGGLISHFTSYGPSNDFYLKPAVAAPGGNILSTLPTTQGSYGVESGTSMAAPFVAGSAALILSVKGTDASVGKTLRTLLQTTAKTVPSSYTDGDPLQTVTQQGAGLIDVYQAIHTSTIVSPGELILNDTAHFEPMQSFTVKNFGKTSKKYVLSHVPAGTALTVRAGTIFPSNGPVPLSSDAATVTFNTQSFTVDPGHSHTVILKFSLPEVNDRSTFPVFSGFIEISSGTETQHVSYIGLGASLRDKQVVDDTDWYFGLPIPAVLDEYNNFQTDPTNYTFVGNSWPMFIFRLTFGTPIIRIDLVDANTSLHLHGLHSLSPIADSVQLAKGKVKTLGAIARFDYMKRNDEDGYYRLVLDTPTFANGITIPNGSYRFLLRALKVTGDPTKKEDYESWLSPIVGIYASASTAV